MASPEIKSGSAGTKRLYAIVNVHAGGYSEARFRRGIEFLRRRAWQCSVYETTGNDSVADVARRALLDDYDVIAAAGGDGTISAVADALVGSDTPLLIVPCGTGNALARELAIPLAIERALGLLAIEHHVRHMDAMQVDGRFYVLVVSIGLTPTIMKETKQEAKRKYGRAAYVAELLKRIVGLQPERFELIIDSDAHRLRAAEIVITNVAQVGSTMVRWGPDVRVDDGKIEVCPVYARTLVDVVGVVWELLFGKRRGLRVRRMDAHTRVRVTSSRPLLVEGDGDVIGETPLDLSVVTGAIRVVVPKPGVLNLNPNLALLLGDMPIGQLLRPSDLLPDGQPGSGDRRARRSHRGAKPDQATREMTEEQQGPAMIAIKPHHFVDIIGYYGTDTLRLTPHPYGHANHLVARRLLEDRDAWIRIELGADDVCAPCVHNVAGTCDDSIDVSFRPTAPSLKRDYNLLVDQRWCQLLGLRQGDALPAKELCHRLLGLESDILEVYAEMPHAYAAEKLRTTKAGAERYLAEQ